MASADAVSPAPATSAAAQQQLRTVVLRVSIHCLGCKKKVRKVLRSIEGVKDVKVDAAMHKVTVTGTVDGDTLVKRLYKSGKQAVPWQHPHVAPAPEAVKAIEAAPQQPEAAPAGDNDGGKGSDAAAAAAKEAAAQAESSEEKKTEEKPEAEKEAEKKEEEQEAKPSDEAKKDAGGESEAAPEAKAKGDDVGAEPAKEAVPAAAVKEASNDDEGAKDEKSKPKDAGDAAPPAAATTTERSLHFSPTPAAHKQHEEHYPYPYYGAPQPVMSYHMAQPTTSVSYYAPRAGAGVLHAAAPTAAGVLRAAAAAAAIQAAVAVAAAAGNAAAVVAVVPVHAVPALVAGHLLPRLLQPAGDGARAAAAGRVPHVRRREPQRLQRHVNATRRRRRRRLAGQAGREK
ncbi:hypothetical protein OsJ_10817 [Oryza sativa Japonica Group]|uniref:HMA domain-containing protein n=1 Tax=Oryza sativa subsp. japonica TaxID=39947 RepID=A3AHV3_ORYSJ|nr:hypothetical protein OsJ_10817 [Oryza sativa Japonica Group]